MEWKRYVMRWAIWYHLYNFKNVKNTHGEVLILVKLQASACNFTEISTPPWVFFRFFKLYIWYQIAQRTKYSIGKYASENAVAAAVIKFKNKFQTSSKSTVCSFRKKVEAELKKALMESK